MIGRGTALLLAGAMSFAASAARAEDQEPILRCLAATSALAGSPDKAVAQVGAVNAIYWLGRLDQTMSEADLLKRLTVIVPTLVGDALQREFKRCGAELEARGLMLQRVGKAMQEHAIQSDHH